MSDIDRTGPPLRICLALWISTARWYPPRRLSAPDRSLLAKAMRDGWRFRSASPRWDAIWRPCARDLARMRVVVLPGRGFGMSMDERMALSWARLAEAGLRIAAIDPLTLQAAEWKRRQTLAPLWIAAAHHCEGGRR